MAIPLTTNINTNAPRPLDSKTIVGVGQEYANKNQIPYFYRYVGMRVFDQNLNIEYQLVKVPSGSLVGYENAGSSGVDSTVYYWKNISFGATPMIFSPNGTWLNEINSSFQCVTGQSNTFSAITFGDIKKVMWYITKNGGATLQYKKETITHTFSQAGTYIIKFKVWDKYDNSLEYSYTTNVTVSGTQTITGFVVTPYAGIKNGSVTTRTYDFTLTTSETIDINQIYSIDISYEGADSSITVPLIENRNLINGASLFNNNTISILGNSGTVFKNLSLNIDTEFTATLTMFGSDPVEETATYVSVNKIVIDPSLTTVSYNNDTNILTSTAKLTTEYDEYSSVTGKLTVNGTSFNYGYVDNSTFILPKSSISLNPGTYNAYIELTQRVTTGVGTLYEEYKESYTILLDVEEPEYLVTFHVKDDLPTPEYVEDCTILISKNGSLYRTLSAPIGVASTELSNSNQYSVVVSKDNYLSLPAAFIVDSSDITISLEVTPIRSFANSNVLNVLPGLTCNVVYNLLPDNKYEEYVEITFTVTNGATEVYTKTETDLLYTDTYDNLAIDARWNTYTLTVLITSYYYGTSISTAMITEIGEAIPLWGYLSEIENPSTKTITDIINDYITEPVLAAADPVPSSYLTNPNNPHLLYQTGLCGGALVSGYMWVAFPDTYPTYTHYADYGDPNYFEISTLFYSGTKVVGTTTYTIYVCIGSETPPPNFGNPIPGMGDLSLRTY